MLRPLSFTHMCCIIMIFLVGTTVRLTKMYDFLWASQVAQWQRIRLPMQEMQEMRIPFPGQEAPLEKEMAIHSSILAWKIPWTEESEGLQSTGSQRVGHNWACTHTHVILYASLLYAYFLCISPVCLSDATKITLLSFFPKWSCLILESLFNWWVHNTFSLSVDINQKNIVVV